MQKQITVEEGISYFEELATKVYSGKATRKEEDEFWIIANINTGL